MSLASEFAFKCFYNDNADYTLMLHIKVTVQNNVWMSVLILLQYFPLLV